MDHRNFTNNNPVVSWTPYPGASGYLVVAMVENRGTEAGGAFFIPAFYYHTMGTSVTIDSHLISFTPTGSQPAQINRGDFVVFEVYAIDGSGFLDRDRAKIFQSNHLTQHLHRHNVLIFCPLTAVRRNYPKLPQSHPQSALVCREYIENSPYIIRYIRQTHLCRDLPLPTA